MSKPSRRPNREAITAQRKDKKRAEKLLRQRQKAQGLHVSSGFSVSNCAGMRVGPRYLINIYGLSIQ